MYQSFIGLEVNIHLLTKTKGFCGCRSAFGDEPNANTCPDCLAYPGTLPAVNIEALRMGCTVARALNCTIPEKTWFDRKQYFYPDISKNYQISQNGSPLGRNGYIDIEGKISDKEIKKRVRIKQCRLEEDAGKMIHTGTVSLLDYNRAGISLMEIITEPDFENGEEAELFIHQLRRMVRYLGVCDGNMEEGSLRADANVSVNVAGKGPGQRVEIKNLNSSRFVKLGINYEIARHGELLDAGKPVVQETRLWNENHDETMPVRRKENADANANDYRYFPDPDLPVFIPDTAFLKSVDDAIPELPLPRSKRIADEYGLLPEQADLICEEKALADYFEATVASVAELSAMLSKKEAAARVANWLLQDIKHVMGREGVDPQKIGTAEGAFRLTPRRFAGLIAMTAGGKITGKNARQTLEAVITEDKDPEEIVRERGWEIISDPAEIAKAVEAVAQAEAATVTEAKAADVKRRKTLTAYLVGKVLAATGGRADPKTVGEQIEGLLNGE